MQAHEHVSEPLPLGSLLGSMAVQEEWGGGVGRGEAQSGYTEVPASVRRMSSNLFHVVIMHTDKVRRLARSILATQCTKQRCVYERLRKLTLRASYEWVGCRLSGCRSTSVLARFLWRDECTGLGSSDVQ